MKPGNNDAPPVGGEVLHLWRLTTAGIGAGVEVEASYVCELHPEERLDVPPGGVHPREC